MRVGILALAVVALSGCGESGLSADRTAELVRAELLRDNEVRMSTVFPRCRGGRNLEACVEAAQCVEAIADEHAPEDVGQWVNSWIITGYPVFRPVNVRVDNLTDNLAEGVKLDGPVRETATAWVQFAAAEDVSVVSSCPAFAALLGVLAEPTPFDVEIEGTPVTNGQRVSWEWKIRMLRPQRDPAEALPQPRDLRSPERRLNDLALGSWAHLVRQSQDDEIYGLEITDSEIAMIQSVYGMPEVRIVQGYGVAGANGSCLTLDLQGQTRRFVIRGSAEQMRAYWRQYDIQYDEAGMNPGGGAMTVPEIRPDSQAQLCFADGAMTYQTDGAPDQMVRSR